MSNHMTQHDQTKPQKASISSSSGHVDHGKSTLVGRLYADTGSLPEGKLEKVQAICRQQGRSSSTHFCLMRFWKSRNRASRSIRRTFFIWNGRQYIIIDAPGHKEF